MKKILFVATLFSATFAFAQSSQNLLGKLKTGSFTIKRMDDVYSICFEDQEAVKKKTIKCFSFIGDATTLRNVYETINAGFATKEKTKTIKVPVSTAEVYAVFNKKDMHLEIHDKMSMKPAVSEELDRKDFAELFGMENEGRR